VVGASIECREHHEHDEDGHTRQADGQMVAKQAAPLIAASWRLTRGSGSQLLGQRAQEPPVCSFRRPVALPASLPIGGVRQAEELDRRYAAARLTSIRDDLTAP
jgi:hypothetical protein